MIDASKAFDRVRFDKLFYILYERGLPPKLLFLLIEMYTQQKCRSVWDGECSSYFSVLNGVRQGVFYPQNCIHCTWIFL